MAANTNSSPSAGCPRRKFDFLFSLLLFAGLVAPLRAQETGVSMKIDVVAWGDEIGGLSFKAGEKSADITAQSFRYSQPVSYSGPALMEIFKNGDGNIKPKPQASKEDLEHEMSPLKPDPEAVAKDGQAKDGIALELENRRKKTPNLVSLAVLPAGCSRATVLLAPAGDGTFVAYVIDDDPSKLPIGQLRVHNLSPYTIAMRFGDAPLKEIKPRAALLAPAEKEEITYDLTYQVGAEWKFQEHNFLPIFPKEQIQMVVLKSNNSYFMSSDGSSGGFMQVVTLRRGGGK